MGKHFTEDERRKIQNYLEIKMSKAQIARELHKSYSAVCREIKRGTVKQALKGNYKDIYVYKWDYAQIVHLEACSNRGPVSILSEPSNFKSDLICMIKTGYSPETALLLLKQTYDVTICYKTVYNAIDRGDLEGLRLSDLPYKKPQKKKKEKETVKEVCAGRRSIDERPLEILDRLDFGHWEMDCVVSGQCTPSKAALLVLTERKTRFSFVFKMPDKTQASVKACLDKLEQAYKEHFKNIFKTVTMDNGTEFINQQTIETSVLNPEETRLIAYYCHPYSAFERGSNENYNRFIRRFIEKGADIAKLSESFIQHVMDFINSYPRKMFNFQSSSSYLKNELSILKII